MTGHFLRNEEGAHVPNNGDTASWFCESVKTSFALETKLSSLRRWLRKIR